MELLRKKMPDFIHPLFIAPASYKHINTHTEKNEPENKMKLKDNKNNKTSTTTTAATKAMTMS